MVNMNRRNVLLGLGTAAAGSGAVFGSGAFTQVQADRDVSINVTGDNNALLGIEPTDNAALARRSGAEVVFDNLPTGANVNSTLGLGAELVLTNNGDDPVYVFIDVSDVEAQNAIDSLFAFSGVSAIANSEFNIDDSPGDVDNAEDAGSAQLHTSGPDNVTKQSDGVVLAPGAKYPVSFLIEFGNSTENVNAELSIYAVGDGDEELNELGPTTISQTTNSRLGIKGSNRGGIAFYTGSDNIGDTVEFPGGGSASPNIRYNGGTDPVLDT